MATRIFSGGTSNYRPPTPSGASTANLITSIPGVGSATSGGPQITSPLARQEVQQNATPMQRYQEAIKKKLQEGQQRNNDLMAYRAARSKFNQAYNIKQQRREVGKFNGYQGGGYAYTKKSATGWGGYRNGQIPSNAMRNIGGGHYLRADAAANFARMNAAFRQAFGRNISITDSYRPIGSQVRLKKQKPGLAATPGTSNHGWGLALDLGGGINRHGTAQNNWMKRYARQFGFHPLSGNKGRLEPWHWEFRG